jgi:hypothetical protein
MLTRTLRALAATAAATVAVTMVGTAAAEAGPTKPGLVTITSATASPGSTSGSYAFSSTWTASANATAYKVVLTNAGVTVASTTVSTLGWDEDVVTTPGLGTLAVTPVAGHFKGTTVRKNVTFADVTAPTGTYTSTWDNSSGQATITQDSRTDDSPVAQVTRTVNWHETSNSPDEAWTTSAPLTHTYPLTEARYVPTVTLTDAAGNTRVVKVSAVVINDKSAPTGTFVAAPGTAWATLTPVTVTQSALADNWSPAKMITRSLDWGDGTVDAWPTGTSLSHVYGAAGSYTPKVTLTDEAHNSSPPIATSAVVVGADTTAPVVKLLLPRAKHSVKAWRTLRGRATDPAGTGVRSVTLRAVEKRGTRWYAYKPTTKTWVRATTKAKAFARSGTLTVHPNTLHRWAGTLVGLRKGTLVYRVNATDHVGNVSARLTHKATLTKR